MRKKNPEEPASIMVDCSHGNSSKNHLNQPKVAADLAQQIAAGETGIVGIMFESNINGGKQSSDKGRENLDYGVSITDGQSQARLLGAMDADNAACVDWDMTLDMLDNLNQVGGSPFGSVFAVLTLTCQASVARRELLSSREGNTLGGEIPAVKRLKTDE